MATAAALLAAVAVAASFSTLDIRRVEREAPGPASPPPQVAGQPAAPTATPGPGQQEQGWSGLGDLLLVLMLLAALALLAAGGWALARALHRRGWWSGARRRYRLRGLRPAGAAPAGRPDGEELLAAVDEAVARSEDDRDPRRAVIACWVRLAEAAGAAGIPRHASDTATDLVLRLLRGQQVSEPVLAAFVDVYWLARYATHHPVDEQMRTQARSALRRLRAELGTPVPA